MQKTGWAKREAQVIAEIKTDKPNGLRYWIARLLLHIAARIINSKVITRRTLPVSEAK
jgi:hypothetical protein